MNTDGTEDEEIHCLKEGGMAVEAGTSIQRDTATPAAVVSSCAHVLLTY